MASTTTNLGLTLPAGTENVSRQVLNGNFETIDEKVGELPEGYTIMDRIGLKADVADPIFGGAISLNRQLDTTKASGSVACGYRNTASGENSHGEGYYSEATGKNSHAEGNYTIANHLNQHASGQYNVADPSASSTTELGNYVEIVGNGTSVSARSNARTLDWNGNETLNGNITLFANADGSGGKRLVFNNDGTVTWELVE